MTQNVWNKTEVKGPKAPGSIGGDAGGGMVGIDALQGLPMKKTGGIEGLHEQKWFTFGAILY